MQQNIWFGTVRIRRYYKCNIDRTRKRGWKNWYLIKHQPNLRLFTVNVQGIMLKQILSIFLNNSPQQKWLIQRRCYFVVLHSVGGISTWSWSVGVIV